MTKKTIKSIVSLITLFIAPLAIFAQETPSAPVPASTDGMSMDINIILTVIAVFLLLPLYMSSKTFLFSVKHYAERQSKSNQIKNGISILIGFLFLSFNSIAQTAETVYVPQTQGFASEFVTGVLLVTIVLEVLLIIIYSWLSNRLIKPTKEVHLSVVGNEVKQSWLASAWAKMNNFKELGEENDIDTGHDYDGIRELDNITPPWFTTTFYLCILWAVFYLYTHHVSKSEPLQIQEFETEMAQAEEEKALFLSKQSNNVDENTVKMLDAGGIANGKTLFESKCAACHAANAGSMPGGVGPNLTDNYWLHGGSISDIFKTIKYGWPEKGMISWKDQLTPTQIAELSSFILNAKGSVKSGGKEPQGEEFKEVAAATIADTTAK